MNREDLWIKICGLHSAEVIRELADLPVTAAGLNRYKPSPRYVTRKRGQELARAARLHGELQLVGVYVDAPVEKINEDIDAIGLDYVQLHGDESPGFLRSISRKVKILKAFRVDEDFDVSCLDRYDCWAYLLDARVEGKYGGTGQKAPWRLISNWTADYPLVLAGGLNPGNIRQAVETVNPRGVDLNSGVEDEQGFKEISKIKEALRAIDL